MKIIHNDNTQLFWTWSLASDIQLQILDITITLVSSNDITKHVLLNSSHFMHSSGNGEINCVKLCRYLRIVVFGLLLPTSNSLFLAFTVFSVRSKYIHICMHLFWMYYMVAYTPYLMVSVLLREWKYCYKVIKVRFI